LHSVHGVNGLHERGNHLRRNWPGRNLFCFVFFLFCVCVCFFCFGSFRSLFRFCFVFVSFLFGSFIRSFVLSSIPGKFVRSFACSFVRSSKLPAQPSPSNQAHPTKPQAQAPAVNAPRKPQATPYKPNAIIKINESSVFT
jgi:hypothetical protein